jgi:hypothetical protein
VIVVSIPSHREYAPDTRAALHPAREEASRSVERNTAEFAYY